MRGDIFQICVQCSVTGSGGHFDGQDWCACDLEGRLSPHFVGLAMFGGVWQAGGMKKQLADQSFHDRRYQERKRAEAERKVPKKKVVKPVGESRVGSS
jgi:hypothetical protein